MDLGVSAPRLYRARPRALNTPLVEPVRRGRSVVSEARSNCSSRQQIEVDMQYTDTLSVSISTSVLLNYPLPSFARLPISLTISLAVFSSTVSDFRFGVVFF